MTPKVSVLMPVYKTNPEYLRAAINSILEQTFKDYEFLIVDDCSEDDNLKHLLAEYAKTDARIKYYVNKQNLGISQTRNHLLSLAKGQYIAVMDHDDVSLPERLAKEVKFLDDNPEVGVVGCWYEKFPKYKLKKRYIVDCQIKKSLMSVCAVLHPSAMIRKSVLDTNNIRYEEKFSPAEDYALWVRLINKTKFANLPEVLFKYRDYDSNTSKRQADKMKQAQQKIYDVLKTDYPEYWQAAHSEQTIGFCKIPLLSKSICGCKSEYKLFNLFKIKNNEPVDAHDCTQLPIYIISFNRLSYLKSIIAVLEKYGLKNIHIIDNVSTYPPMLQYLKQTPYTVHYMPKNYGHKVFFEAEEFKSVRENEYYVLTDPDVIPVKECPADFMNLFYRLLQQYPKVNKVGFSLKLDDLPDCYMLKKLTIRWERQFYKKALNWFKPVFYKSSLDTTFAMYRPQKKRHSYDFFSAIRVGAPYEARHLPWYKDLSQLTEEDEFYNQLDCGSGNWNSADAAKKIEEQLFSKGVEHWYEHLFSYKESSQKRILRIAGIKLSLHKR